MNLRDRMRPPVEPRNDWNPEGVVILRGVLDGRLMAAYEDAWMDANWLMRDGCGTWRDGWPEAMAYLDVPEMLDLLLSPPIPATLNGLIGEPGGLHLVLSGWRSTQRDWHQDAYLNPAFVGDSYAAAWLCLADVHPDAGPFQYVPGSHAWPQVTLELIGEHVDLGDPMWPKHSEAVLTELFDGMIAEFDAPIVTYLPARGDVLFWHPRLLHRGSVPADQWRDRRALIAHYSGVHHRPDFPVVVAYKGGHYFTHGRTA